MLNWLRKMIGSNVEPIHPPWRAGQYVTYFLEREDGSWVAVALRLLGKTEDGAWLLSADFKTPHGESTAWLRSDHDSPLDTPDPVPLRQESIRKAQVDEADSGRLQHDPMMAAPLAMNLLMVRRWPEASESLRKEPRRASYPCGIDQVYSLITSGPGYQKHHDINPRVMLTGVACLSIDGGKNPMTVTSFGLNDPAAAGPATYEDFVDFSHAKSVKHEGFSLSYPATWFLRPLPGEKEEGAEAREHVREHVGEHVGEYVGEYVAQMGGVSCSVSLSVRFHSGPAHQITEERDAVVSRLSAPLDGPMGRLSPREPEPFRLGGKAWGFVADLKNSGIDGLAYAGLYCADSGDRLAHVTAFGCISKTNPRRAATLAEMESSFREILDSFRFE
jgi:hypothetical protein